MDERIGICQECYKIFQNDELRNDGRWGHMCKVKRNYTEEHRCESYIQKYVKEQPHDQ